MADPQREREKKPPVEYQVNDSDFYIKRDYFVLNFALKKIQDSGN